MSSEAYEDQDFVSRVGRMLDEKHRARAKEKGYCPKCCGSGTADCGGLEIACDRCDGDGKWREGFEE